MTQPTPEAYEAAGRRWLEDPERPTTGLNDHELAAAARRVAQRNGFLRGMVEAVWPLAYAAGRQARAAEIRGWCEEIRATLLGTEPVEVGRRLALGEVVRYAARIAEGGTDG